MGNLIQLCFIVALQIFSLDHIYGRGLTIKLIHRDSPDSPLYQPNLTRTDRTKSLILQTIARSNYLAHRGGGGRNNSSRNAVRPKVDHYHNSIFMAEVGFGTFTVGDPYKKYFLHVDTGSSLTWTQCEGCRAVGHHCFYQAAAVFPNTRSSTYRNLVYEHNPLCFPGYSSGNFCTYFTRYMDGGSSRGFLAYESFTFDSSAGSETIPGMVFGCGLINLEMKYGRQGKVAGLLGLGWGQHSLVNQLAGRARSTFSYCFQSKNAVPGISTMLRFGSDIPAPPGLVTTALVRVPSDPDMYYVNLIDISVGERRLGIPPVFLSRREGGESRSGTIIDSGAEYTMVVLPVYGQLVQVLDSYLRVHLPEARRTSVEGVFRTCYQAPSGWGQYYGLPTVTFHFEGGGDMVVQQRGTFYVGGTMRKPFFCLAMLSSGYDPTDGGLNMLSALQQTDQLVIYDLMRRQLRFAPQDCSRL